MEPTKKTHGALIGSIIVIVLLIIGGIYIWQTKVKQIKIEREQAQEKLNELGVGSIEELNTLEQEFNSTDTSIDINSVDTLE